MKRQATRNIILNLLDLVDQLTGSDSFFLDSERLWRICATLWSISARKGKSVLYFPEIRLTFQQQLLKFLVLLLQDIAVNEINVLQANFNSLVLENEQLKSEINEMKEKLKEKIEMDEFEALEKQTQKDHEVRCIAINTER